MTKKLNVSKPRYNKPFDARNLLQYKEPNLPRNNEPRNKPTNIKTFATFLLRMTRHLPLFAVFAGHFHYNHIRAHEKSHSLTVRISSKSGFKVFFFVFVLRLPPFVLSGRR